VVTSSVSFTICKLIFHFLDSSSGPTFKCLSVVYRPDSLHFSITSSISAHDIITTFTKLINCLQNAYSFRVNDNLPSLHLTWPYCS
jgi:hypothetical protein